MKLCKLSGNTVIDAIILWIEYHTERSKRNRKMSKRKNKWI